MTALFGASMPALYIIGFVSFGVSIFVEKLTLCYFYREPPMYDESITKVSMKVVKLIVPIGLFLTFWQLGNRHIFDNDAGVPLVLQTESKLSDRSVFDTLRRGNPFRMTYNSPPIVLLAIICLYYAVKPLYRSFFKRPRTATVSYSDSASVKSAVTPTKEATGRLPTFSHEKGKREQLTEGLLDYYVALDDNDHACFLGQEEYFRDHYGVSTLSADDHRRLLEAVDHVKIPSKTMQGVGTYRPLDNPDYMARFAYLPQKRRYDKQSKTFTIRQQTFIAGKSIDNANL